MESVTNEKLFPNPERPIGRSRPSFSQHTIPISVTLVTELYVLRWITELYVYEGSKKVS